MDYRVAKDEVVSLIKEVGAYQHNKMQENFLVETKTGITDLVTEVDKCSEEMIISFISEKYPSHSILAEEGGNKETDSDYCWIIDPLDGTNNYAHGFPMFTISIALEFQEQPVIGVIYHPILDECYWAIKGEGAYLNDQKLEVSHTECLAESLIVTGFPYNKKIKFEQVMNIFNYFITRVRGIRRTGSAAYDLCNVARGVLDGFWELRLKHWDIAAGQLIVKEAGGDVNIFSKEDGYSLAAGNHKITELLLAGINQFK